MKRFWKAASAEPGGDGHAILIDGKPVQTPHRRPLAVPVSRLAEAIAGEWNNVGETVDPRAMPLTGLANAAIDLAAPDPVRFAATLTGYIETDLLLYRAETPASLVEAQHRGWDPLLDWARSRYDVHFVVISGIIHHPQPAATIERLSAALSGRDAFTLAGLSPVITIGGSMVAALALLEGAFDAECVWQATALDELWQEQHWGADALARAARDARRADYDAACRFLDLLR
jgi:chaperone required for assembly of F1-ATPase